MASRVVATLVCNDYYTLCVSYEGHISWFGFCFHINQSISGLENIISITGTHHILCLSKDGNVFPFGNNNYGELGLGKDVSGDSEFQKIDLPPIKQICCGEYFSICLSDNGTLYSFGNNDYGQLALFMKKDYYLPKNITYLKGIEFVECGYGHVCCKSVDGSIYCWGKNEHGELGIKTLQNQLKPYKCKEWPNDVVDIKCGFNHTIVLTESQKVYSCGNNAYNQLGRVTDTFYSSLLHPIEELSDIIRIECGYRHSSCIDINNDLYVFGDNQFGQLGLGDIDNRIKPIKHPSLSNIIDISKGGNQTFVKTSNNEIYAFGSNCFLESGVSKFSQLDQGIEDDYQVTPIQVFKGEEHIWYSHISKAKSARFIVE